MAFFRLLAALLYIWSMFDYVQMFAYIHEIEEPDIREIEELDIHEDRGQELIWDARRAKLSLKPHL
ncbi:hypothetical protein ACAG25_07335 [Mycobacterium sp. pV006]|uniref:hypothetical protein n=1 Tax=Mycobacterium sp. pV006 TaxID=3238983 RepID=UPI00351BAE86